MMNAHTLAALQQNAISAFDIATRVAIPVATFALGALIAYLVQRHWRKRDVVDEAAKAVVELTAEWYNQLEELRRKLIDAPNTEAARLVDAYLRNRLILPRLVYNLAILRDRNVRHDLVANAEEFLSTVTTYRPYERRKAVECAHLFHQEPGGPAHAALANVLRQLDAKQQAIVREAARTTDS